MNIEEKNYVAGLYIRLSKEDGDKEESESVQNQRKILKAFTKENKIKVYKEYVDDGYSGTNFNRPDFKNMINDIKQGKINMVITKTLSRLGRDYIETGRYIENFFPENNVRYIAILDDVDTFLDKNCDTIAFKNIMNDYYAKETSKNIKKTKNKKKQEGFYYVAYAPFGYKKIDKSGNLEIVESQANLVKRIYEMFLAGKGTYQIAKQLTEEKILTPGLQMNMACVQNHLTNTTDKWRHETIKRILTNRIYIGDCVQNKTKKISYKSKKMVSLSSEENTITKNHHQPIINIDDWNKVQKMLENKKNMKIRDTDATLKGLIYCSHCECRYTFSTSVKKNKKIADRIVRYMHCSNNKAITNKICNSKYMQYDPFEEKVLKEIDSIIDIYLKYLKNDKIYEKFKEKNNVKNEYETKIKKLEAELELTNKKIRTLYNDKLNEIIEEEDYLLFSKNLTEERKRLEKNIEELNSEIKSEQSYDEEEIKVSIDKIIKKYKKESVHSKEILNQLVKKISVDEDKNVIIYFNFKELNYARGYANVVQP